MRSRIHPQPFVRRLGLAVSAVVLLMMASVYADGSEGEGETAAAAAPAEVLRIRIDSTIHPVIADFIAESVAEADASGAAALVLELATPGGLMVSTREILTALLGAATPVVVYVAPSGAQAASAGFFILMAADVAAMAPGSNTGAAHPVGGKGEDIEGTMGEKVEQDSAATIRSLAQRHGRNVELAEAAVIESRSFSAEEALEVGLIEVVAPNLSALLAEIDGREVDKGGGPMVLATAGAPVRELEMPVLRRILSVLASPDVAFILLSIGMLGLYVEFTNPGAIFPGVVGAICLIFAFAGLSVLPVNYVGVALVLLAIVLFIAEIKVVSFGLLTIGGVISLVLGGLMLFDTPEPAVRVSLEVIVGVAATALILVAILATLVIRAHRSRVHTGSDGLLRQTARAYTALTPRGKVFIQGEIWNAVSDRPVERDAAVEVVAVDGLMLKVRPRADGDGDAVWAPTKGSSRQVDSTAITGSD